MEDYNEWIYIEDGRGLMMISGQFCPCSLAHWGQGLMSLQFYHLSRGRGSVWWSRGEVDCGSHYYCYLTFMRVKGLVLFLNTIQLSLTFNGTHGTRFVRLSIWSWWWTLRIKCESGLFDFSIKTDCILWLSLIVMIIGDDAVFRLGISQQLWLIIIVWTEH